jgi:hypothetical protein
MKSDGWARTVLMAVLLPLAGCEFDFSVAESAEEKVLPSDWWECPERLAGSWTFGRAPYGCSVDAFGSAATVRTEFGAYIFDDDAPQDGERIRYMGEFQPFLADQAAAYLRSRRPDVSDQEVAQWQHAIYATAHQESFWTHYREASVGGGRLLTMLRGDQGHGHGLMQVDDRYHTAAIESGYGWRLDDNLVYALDIYYDGWQRAPDAWCVAAPVDWAERARAAYSAYNGGPGQICRWTAPTSAWAQNDAGYYDKYVRQEWQYYVAD